MAKREFDFAVGSVVLCIPDEDFDNDEAIVKEIDHEKEVVHLEDSAEGFPFEIEFNDVESAIIGLVHK